MDDGGPAYPGYTMHDDGESISVTKLNPGMSLRDYFAGQALAGMVVDFDRLLPDEETTMPGNINAMAIMAYHIADAMLAARND